METFNRWWMPVSIMLIIAVGIYACGYEPPQVRGQAGENLFLPLVADGNTAPTATPIPLPDNGRCSMAPQAFERGDHAFTAPANGAILTLWTDRPNVPWGTAEVKALVAPGSGLWRVFDVGGTWSSNPDCTWIQIQYEFQEKSGFQIKSWAELCNAGITCKQEPTPTATPVPPTSTPMPTSTPTHTATPLATHTTAPTTPAPAEVCPADQIRSRSLARGNHEVAPARSGNVLLLWTDRAVDPPWGIAEVKAWMAPDQPAWQIFDAGGTLLWSDTCTAEQMYQRFLQEDKQEVSWQALCDEGLTCSKEPAVTPTPTIPPTTPASGCPHMEQHDLATIAGPFPSSPNGAIFTLWREDVGEVKYWHGPGEGPVEFWGVEGSWWIAPQGQCTIDLVYSEFLSNALPEKKWDELCSIGITCAPAPPTPAPTEVCPADQIQSQTLARGNHTVSTHPVSGVALFLWTSREVNPPWGTAEVKAWVAPNQPTWEIFDTGGTLLWSDTCTADQMYARFREEAKQEVTWQELCDAEITCQ